MREFAVYDPQDFDLNGSPAEDEAFAILKDLNTGKLYLTYIYTEDYDTPPKIDLDCIEEIHIEELELGNSKAPCISHICMRKDGTVVMDEAEYIKLDDKQNDILARPCTLFTLNGKYVAEYNEGGETSFYQDLTLEGVKAVKLDFKKTIDAISGIHQDMIKPTHERYGNKFPYFPFGKYYEEEEQMVVFITSSQLKQMDDRLLKGEIPFYQNFFLADKWDINTTYAVCVVDEKTYNARLLNPKSLYKIKNQMLNAEKAEAR